MEKLVDHGLVRHIGTSNMTIPKLELLLKDARIRPACNEMELHPHFQQPNFSTTSSRNRFSPLDIAHSVRPAALKEIARPRILLRSTILSFEPLRKNMTFTPLKFVSNGRYSEARW